MGRKGIPLEDIEKVLEAKAGFVTIAADALCISYQALFKRIQNSKRLQDVLKAVNEKKLDFTESKLIEQVREGNLGAICFHLKCKGKHRGYVERSELSLNLKKSATEMDDSELESTVRAILAGISTEAGTQK